MLIIQYEISTSLTFEKFDHLPHQRNRRYPIEKFSKVSSMLIIQYEISTSLTFETFNQLLHQRNRRYPIEKF